jgi:hypothetical protein
MFIDGIDENIIGMIEIEESYLMIILMILIESCFY